MLTSFDYYSLSLFVGGFVAIISGAIVYITNRREFTNLAWFLLTISTAVWSFGYFLMINAPTYNIAFLSNWILHYSAIFIPVFYFLFVLAITGYYERYKKILFLSVVFLVIFLVLNSTSLLVRDVLPKFIFHYAPDAGPFYIYFTLYFFTLVLSSLFILILKIRNADAVESQRLKYILFSSSAGFIGGGSVFFLTFNINLPPYPLIFFTFYPIIIAYAILRHNLFNVKIIATELFIFILWIIILIRVFLSQTPLEKGINITLLALIVIFGTLLIKGVTKEVRTRERIEGLVKDLAKANEHLRQMEQQKSEFVSIASHQLRTPLTAIKGYASMILEGSFGALNEQARDAVEKLFKSSQRLVGLVEDFLTVSRIERGKMQFDFTFVDLKELIGGVVKDLEIDARDKGPVLTFQIENGSSYVVRGDALKLKQVFTNIIDNAIKFTNHGFIRVLLSRNEETKKIRIAISDTGAGMDFNTILHLFKRFDEELTSNRGKSVGMSPGGLGLYVSHQIVKAHGGNIWAQSEGMGKGSTFFIELPEKGNEIG